MPEGEGRQRRHLGQQTDDLNPPILRVVHLFGFRVEGRQRRHRRDHHPHGVGVVPEALKDGQDVLVHVGMEGHPVNEVVELLPSREFSVQDQVGNLEERGLPGKLLDGVPAVLQDALAALYIRNPAGGKRGVGEGGVVGHHPEVGVVHLDPAQIHGADHVAVEDIYFVFPARAVVDDGQGVSGVVLGHLVSGAGLSPGKGLAQAAKP